MTLTARQKNSLDDIISNERRRKRGALDAIQRKEKEIAMLQGQIDRLRQVVADADINIVESQDRLMNE